MNTVTASDKANVVRFQAATSSKTRFRFTRERIQKAITPLMRLGRPFMLRDTDVPGLCLRRQTSDRLVFMLEKRHAGKLHRITLAPWSANADIEAVRARARDLSYSIMSGTYEAEAAATKAAKAAGVDELTGMTIAEVVDAHIRWTDPPLRARTAEGYKLAAKQVANAGKLTTKPVAQWTLDDVRAAYAALTSETSTTSAVSASGYMRCLRAAVEHWRWRFPEALVPNNVITTGMKLGHKSRWVVAPPRPRSLLARETRPFLDAADTLANTVDAAHAGVYRLIGLLALTGMRFLEGAALRWAEVDLKHGTLNIGAQRMKGKKAFTKPLGHRAVELLELQKGTSGDGEFVFPSVHRAGAHIDDARYAMSKVCEAAACTKVTPHDLRRTYLRAAEACGLPVSRIKALVHHATGNDITASYVGYGFIDDAGDDAQRVEDFLMGVR